MVSSSFFIQIVLKLPQKKKIKLISCFCRMLKCYLHSNHSVLFPKYFLNVRGHALQTNILLIRSNFNNEIETAELYQTYSLSVHKIKNMTPFAFLLHKAYCYNLVLSPQTPVTDHNINLKCSDKTSQIAIQN